MSEAASALTHDKTYLILTHGDQPFYRGGAERQAGAPSPDACCLSTRNRHE